MPVPVLHHIRACNQVGVDDESELSDILWILRARIPADALGVGFCDQIVCMFERTSQVTRQPDPARIEVLLCFEIWIFRDNVEAARDGPLVKIGVNSAAEILGDELAVPLV